ncbi:hypothetical protein [Halomarina litorea]|uniref:hypothetical protein n=1 Tax=Halomarina litorea TaxID=2961595 RepID=UPI0020C58746|nr:hypothetical protein [Halomarina sp. BCD28]
MTARERDESGKYTETVTLAGVLDVFDRVRGPPVVTSSDVAEHLDCTTEAARQKLARLVERGDVDRRKTGRTVIYWRPDRGEGGPRREATETVREPLRDDGGSTRDDGQTGEHEPPADDSGGSPGTDSLARDDRLEEQFRAYLAGRTPRTSHGKAATVDVFRLLRGRGTMKTSELKAELFDRHGDVYDNEKSLWESVSRYLDEHPGIEKGGYGEWQYAGDEAARDALNE